MSLGLIREGATVDSFPRVSGDEPRVQHTTHCYTRFSPRERG